CFLDHRHPCGIGWSLLAFSTCLQEPYTGFLRSESSFVAVLGLHSTPGYLRVRVSRVIPASSFYERESVARPSFASTILVRLLNPSEPVPSNDASVMHSIRSLVREYLAISAS